MVGRFQWLSNGAAGARHVVPKHRCLQNPANPHMTSASQRSGNARVTAQSSQKVAAQTSPRRGCEFEFLLKTGGRQHTARGDASADFVEMAPARVLARKGKAHQALAAYERVLQQRLADPHRGPLHPETLRAYVSLGNYQRDAGRTGEAAESYRALVTGRVATLGPRHLETLAARFSLAGLLKDLKEFGPARKEYEETVSGYVERLGERHTATLDAMYGLAILLQQSQALKSGGATPKQPLSGMAKIRREKELRELNAASKRQHEAGEQNPPARAAESGEQAGADRVRELYEKVVDGYTAQLGPRHTETLRAQYNLALCLKQNRQLEEAQMLCAPALSLSLSLSLSL